MIKFRSAAYRDFEAVTKLLSECGISMSRLQFTQRYSDGNVFIIAEEEDRIIACAYASKAMQLKRVKEKNLAKRPARRGVVLSDSSEGNYTAIFRNIFVTEDARRGKVGTMLYRIVERDLRNGGVKRLILDGSRLAASDNSAAAFFMNMGFSAGAKDISFEDYPCESEKK